MSSSTAAVFEVYEDSSGEWRWRLVAANGETIADSGQGYSRKENAVRATNAVRDRAPTAAIEFPESDDETAENGIAEH